MEKSRNESKSVVCPSVSQTIWEADTPEVAFFLLCWNRWPGAYIEEEERSCVYLIWESWYYISTLFRFFSFSKPSLCSLLCAVCCIKQRQNIRRRKREMCRLEGWARVYNDSHGQVTNITGLSLFSFSFFFFQLWHVDVWPYFSFSLFLLLFFFFFPFKKYFFNAKKQKEKPPNKITSPACRCEKLCCVRQLWRCCPFSWRA